MSVFCSGKQIVKELDCYNLEYILLCFTFCVSETVANLLFDHRGESNWEAIRKVL